MEGDEEFSFPPNERKVVTQPLDLSVQTLVEQWKAKLLVLPEIQREYVWDNGKASRLVESLLLNIPIPVLYFAETPEATYEIIDGHQRVNSIVRFFSNEFSLSGLAVLREFKGLRFHQLPEREQRFFKMRTLRSIIISIDSDKNMKFEIFERLNTGSISLNSQELRNSIYRGELNRLLRRLAKNVTFRRIVGGKDPRKRMVDEEMILRFFALRSALGTYRPPLKRVLNTYMSEGKDCSEEQAAELGNVFEDTVQRVEALVGNSAFRLMNADGRPLESSVNRALFDAQMLTASWTFGESSPKLHSAILSELAKLNSSTEFLDAIQRATGDRTRIIRRLRDTVSAFRNAGAVVDVPFDLSK